MFKNLTKISVGISTAVSTLYWGVLPALATGGEKLEDLCPNGTGPGFNIPGCKGISVGKTIGSLVGIAFFVALIIALAFLILGGIKWIMSGGDKEGTQKAKETITSALIGLAVVISAFILINLLLQLLTGQSLNGLTVPTLDVGTKTTTN